MPKKFNMECQQCGFWNMEDDSKECEECGCPLEELKKEDNFIDREQ